MHYLNSGRIIPGFESEDVISADAPIDVDIEQLSADLENAQVTILEESNKYNSALEAMDELDNTIVEIESAMESDVDLVTAQLLVNSLNKHSNVLYGKDLQSAGLQSDSPGDVLETGLTDAKTMLLELKDFAGKVFDKINEYLEKYNQAAEVTGEILVEGTLNDFKSLIKEKNDLLQDKQAGLLSADKLSAFGDKLNTFVDKTFREDGASLKLNSFFAGLESACDLTKEMLADINTMVSAKEAGLLSIQSLTMFSNKADNYSDKLGLDLAKEESGLESYSNNLEAGLESVMSKIKEGLTMFMAFLKKVYENITTMFADVYTKLTTSTKGILKEVKDLKDAFEKNKEVTTYKISNETKKMLENKFLTALGIGDYLLKKSDFNSFLLVIEEALKMASEPKLPEVKVGAPVFGMANITIKEANIDKYEKTGVSLFLSQILTANNKAIMENKFNFPTEAIHSAEIRLLYVTGLSIEVLLISSDGRMEIVKAEDNYNGSSAINNRDKDISSVTNSNQLTFISTSDSIYAGYLEVISEIDNKNGIISLLDTIIKSCEKISNNSIRNENNKRINELKKSSELVTKDINDFYNKMESSEMSKEMATRFDVVMREISTIWKIYPRINNECIKGLYNNIKDATSIVKSIKEHNNL